MKVNYSIAFKTGAGVNDWSEDFDFKRDVYAEQPLDETLDTGIVVDVPSSLRKIAPFTLCRVTATEVDTDTEIFRKYYWTADRETEAVTLFGVGNEIGNLAGQKYRQNIKLIELTKILEREPCDSISFTHRLQKNVVDSGQWVEPTSFVCYYRLQQNYPDETKWVQMMDGQTIVGYDSTLLSELYVDENITGTKAQLYGINISINGVTADITSPGSARVQVSGGTATQPNTTYTAPTNWHSIASIPGAEIDFNVDGQYTITYTIETGWGNVGGVQYRAVITYSIDASSDIFVPKPIPTIPDVIDRILNIGSPRPIYIAPKYSLNEKIRERFADTPAPEFFFPRMTKFEALLEVGKKIHAIPRLVFNEDTGKPDTITYDLLGEDEEYRIPTGAEIVGYKNTQASDDYCGAIDNYAENYINTIDPSAGAKTEPYFDGLKTVRCTSGVKITNSTAVIEVSEPIYRIIKVEMGYTNAHQSGYIGDITDYVYEQAEYDGLFTDDGAQYPYSISYALVWKQGDRFIRGLNTTSSSILNIIQQFKKPAINNIANRKIASSMGTGQDYSDLAFSVTYIPMSNIRLRQYKPYEGTHPNDNILYNQQNANTVEASYYGENLKGKIARMGNEVEVYTIRYTSAEQELPKLGNLLVDEDGDVKGYIYKVTTRGARNFIVADVYVTPDFNRLSEYFSLESNFRLYEVSERQSIDRPVMVPRIIEVTIRDGVPSTRPMMTYPGVMRFMNTFDNIPRIGTRPTVATVRLLHDKGEGIDVEEEDRYTIVGKSCYALPMNSTACGNSLAFSFSFEDSYSAGKRASKGATDTDIPLGSSIKWKQLRNSPYGDIYGEFDCMELCGASTLYKTETTRVGIDYEDQEDGICDTLPTISESIHASTAYTHDDQPVAYKNNCYFTTENANDINRTTARVVEKNSSEKISVVIQFHLQARQKSIVFGQAMFSNNFLIKDDRATWKDENGEVIMDGTDPKYVKPTVYGLNKRLNMLRDRIDLSEATPILVPNTTLWHELTEHIAALYSGETTQHGEPLGYVNATGEDFKAWCIANNQTGEIYIGVNETVKNGDRTSPIYFNFDFEA